MVENRDGQDMVEKPCVSQSWNFNDVARFWAVYEDGQLLCVTVYKKGALAVMRRLQQMRRSA